MIRRYFLRSALFIPTLTTRSIVKAKSLQTAYKGSIKISLNAYSFNKELKSGNDFNQFRVKSSIRYHEF